MTVGPRPIIPLQGLSHLNRYHREIGALLELALDLTEHQVIELERFFHNGSQYTKVWRELHQARLLRRAHRGRKALKV